MLRNRGRISLKTRRGRLVALIATLAIFVGSGVAYATIPDASGAIHGCVFGSGQLRIVDHEAGETCRGGETAVSFLGTAGKVADADLLDGVDSTGFLRSGGKAADADLLDGVDSTGFLRTSAIAFGEMFADGGINSNRSRGVTSVQHLGVGSYRVTFARNLTNCAFFVSTPYNALIIGNASQFFQDTANSVTVTIYNLDVMPFARRDTAFDLLAVC